MNGNNFIWCLRTKHTHETLRACALENRCALVCKVCAPRVHSSYEARGCLFHRQQNGEMVFLRFFKSFLILVHRNTNNHVWKLLYTLFLLSLDLDICFAPSASPGKPLSSAPGSRHETRQAFHRSVARTHVLRPRNKWIDALMQPRAKIHHVVVCIWEVREIEVSKRLSVIFFHSC